jgi:hypothetical protein
MSVHEGKQTCDICNKETSRSNFSRHYEYCKRKHGIIPEGPPIPDRVMTGKRATCAVCKIEQSAENMSRHMKKH